MTDDSECSFIVAGEAGEVDIITMWVRQQNIEVNVFSEDCTVFYSDNARC